jgi:uncharacterized membrane protein
MDRVAKSRWLMAAALGVAIAGCGLMLFVRATLTGSFALRLLVWNLFLAAIPFPLAWTVDVLGRRPHVGWPVLAVPAVAWLAFFPNAPYLVTDLVHLEPTGQVPLWYDGLVFFAFAATGLLLGFTSLYLVQATVKRRSSSAWGWLVAFAAIGLGSYGIYLGRVERWNSWDVITHPSALLDVLRTQVTDPLSNRSAIVLTLGFAIFLSTVYAILYAFAHLVRVDGPRTSSGALTADFGD